MNVVARLSKTARNILRPIKRSLLGTPDDYLRASTGIIHVGANTGQERHLYSSYDIPVVWVEPLPKQFKTLQDNIKPFARHTAINALITDQDGQQVTFHVADNDGASSSIFDFHLHRDIWPDIRYEHDIALTTSTLPSALAASGINVTQYNTLVMDTQGSELLVLQGAETILTNFKYIKTEAADFESYKSGATFVQIANFLKKHKFHVVRKDRFAEHPNRGSYYDTLFTR